MIRSGCRRRRRVVATSLLAVPDGVEGVDLAPGHIRRERVRLGRGAFYARLSLDKTNARRPAALRVAQPERAANDDGGHGACKHELVNDPAPGSQRSPCLAP